ncbi:hypothetical protein [Pendulispora albinea]|uniref:Uncharacterized protein n=1 Tax=Pendulispora albinea TaxID=2741071 RepID=A0ABZ2MAZ6_9BACT
MILPVYDARGDMRSVRAWRIIEGDSPKRLPPGGYKTSGLVLADGSAVSVLATGGWIDEVNLHVVITEGEPDFLTWATRYSDADQDAPVVLGVVGGLWTEDMRREFRMARASCCAPIQTMRASDTRYATHCRHAFGPVPRAAGPHEL